MHQFLNGGFYGLDVKNARNNNFQRPPAEFLNYRVLTLILEE